MGINQRNLQLIYPNNPRKFFFMANDKATSKLLCEKHKIPVPETYLIIERAWEIDKKFEEISSLTDFVIKPSNGSGGNGILILRKSGEDQWESPGGKKYTKGMLKMHIASINYGAYSHDNADKCIIEQRIETHPFFTEIYPNGIPDVRVILLQHEPIMAMLRFPTDASGGKANLHQGAIGTGIDMKDGRITQGYYRHRIIHKHPDSGVRFQGMQIPHWNEILSISISVAMLVPLKYIGVDIIVDKIRGPLIIEINARPGLQIQNANLQGLWSQVRKS